VSKETYYRSKRDLVYRRERPASRSLIRRSGSSNVRLLQEGEGGEVRVLDAGDSAEYRKPGGVVAEGLGLETELATSLAQSED
jgi:hypothetical protein